MRAELTVTAMVLMAVVCVAGTAAAYIVATKPITRFTVVIGANASSPEVKAAEILKARLIKRSSVAVDIVTGDVPGDTSGETEATIILGTPHSNTALPPIMKEWRAALPTLPNSDKVHPESYVLRSSSYDGKNVILVIGADGRGAIYGAGRLLREMTFKDGAVYFPSIGQIIEKPAFLLRGGRPTGPGSRARQFGNLRPQTSDEQREVMEDLMMLGANIFEGEPGYVRSYGMMTVFGRTANEMPKGFPKEWRADGGRSEKYVCVSIPEAREALLNSFDEMFKNAPDYDFFTTNSGDEGGCRCEKCMPWGDKYIRLVHDIADILHKYHPNTKVLATNQDLTNEGNQAIFDYLKEGDSSWLYAIRYGPGADEMQTYIRGAVNPRWFEYEGFGPLGNYLKFMHKELPANVNIALYSDITHWMQAQFAVPRPDIALAAVYDRRSWNARPRMLHKAAREILHYALGDMHYSEGMHDDFNKWFWYRMLWNPNQDREALTREYCRYWFGPDAEREAAEAICLMEDTLERPLLSLDSGVSKAVDLMRAAGEKIPENLKKNDYRWRIFMQKALMDRYIQLEVKRGYEDIQPQARKLLDIVASPSSTPADAAASAAQALEILQQPVETPEMKAIRDEAIRLGEESNTIIGYREPAPFIVTKLDLSETKWWSKTLQEAIGTTDMEKLKNAARMITCYSDPGEDGIYDDLGWPNESPHLTKGEALWGFLPFPGPAKRSHYNLAYTMGPKEGVTLSFDGLDPAAQYVVRISVGAHIEGEEASALAGLTLSEGMEADGQVISEGFSIPMGEVALHEFDLPQSVTADGKVRISMTPKMPMLPITGLNEIWVMKKDRMPWTLK